MIRVLFRCGHRHEVNPDKAVSCVTCGDTRVARTLDAEAPRFTGHCTGPTASTVALGAMAVNLATADAEPLKLKPQVRES